MLSEANWAAISCVRGWMNSYECAWLAAVASVVPSWTELGTLAGRSAMAVGLHLPPNATLQLVDIEYQPEFPDTLARLRAQRPDLNITVFHGTTVEASLALADTAVVFIDADHEYDSVKEDILAWRDKAKLLCGHDFDPYYAGLVRAVQELLPAFYTPLPHIWVAAPLSAG